MNPCSAIVIALLAFASRASFAADEDFRQAERRGSIAECIRMATRTGRALKPTWLIRASDTELKEANGRVFVARNEQKTIVDPTRLERLSSPEMREEQGWWFNPGARELQPGDQFVTTTGDTWTKVFQGEVREGQPPKEIWRVKVDFNKGIEGASPAEAVYLLGDRVGSVQTLMSHLAIPSISLALKDLYSYVTPDRKWPNGFNPEAKLRELMSGREIVGLVNIGSPEKLVDFILESIGGILDPDIQWYIPEQTRIETRSWGPENEFSALFRHGLLEVSPGWENRAFYWSSTSSTDRGVTHSHHFSGWFGAVGAYSRGSMYGSLRLVARARVR